MKNLTGYQNPAKIDEQTILQALDLTKENSSPVRYLSDQSQHEVMILAESDNREILILFCKGITTE